jgi:hypothetical protein
LTDLRQLEFETQPVGELASFGPDMVAMYEWLGSGGYSADADRLAHELPEVDYASFRTWAEAQDWDAVLAAVTA